jgi:hypothetical protein
MRNSLQEDSTYWESPVPISLFFVEIARVVMLIRLSLLDLVENHSKQILVPEL